MDFKAAVSYHLEEFLQTRPDLFLLDLKISPTDDVVVILDGDQGITIQDCLDASRAIEFNLDREEHDFSLQVTSPGATEPLTLPRQYGKNIGRTLHIVREDGTEVEADLVAAGGEHITLEHHYRKPKEVGKGKVDAVEVYEIPYSDIRRATVVIKF